MTTDNRELFAKQLTEMMAVHMKQLAERARQDRLMLSMDAIGVEAVRLSIDSWDQITFAELRERLRVARVTERETLFKATEIKI